MSPIIPMQAPVEFLSQLQSGEFIRYGAILKDAGSGQIVGHLKEAGNLASMMSQLPVSPLGAISTASGIVQNFQLKKIQETLNVLQMTVGVGAAASVATLGVSVIGFAVVLKKLKQMDSKLESMDGSIQAIKKVLDQLDMKYELMTMARLQAAVERLSLGMDATDRQKALLAEANKEFSDLRHYFYLLISKLKPAVSPEFTVAETRDLLSRYFTAALGQLHSEFLLNDMPACRKSLRLIHAESLKVNQFKVKDAFRVRSDHRKMLDVEFDHKGLMGEVKGLKVITDETIARIDSSSAEIDYVERHQLNTIDYLEQLKKHEDGLVLVTG